VRSWRPTTTTITTTEVTVALDANGADAGPGVVAQGAALAVSADPALRVRLYAPAREVGTVPDRVELIDAPISIAKAEDPARAVRETPEASVVQAVQAVADGDAGALVSGGSTGAALAASLFRIKRLRGVHRPALALLMPVPGTPFLLVDAGANLEARPEHLVQFAHMGAAYMTAVLGVERPRVALLSNGTEPGKGTETVVAAHEALRGVDGFIGNVEGFAIATGEADVIVTDGFTGNVLLKTMEGTSKALLTAIRAAAMSSTRAKAGGLLLKPALGGLRDGIDPEAQGGALLLGLRGLVVVPHGSFGPRGIAAAVAVAARGVRGDLVARTHAALEAAGALRRAPVMSSGEPGTVSAT
jgi:glycerol-3-phosphate acyltransferase PlsX